MTRGAAENAGAVRLRWKLAALALYAAKMASFLRHVDLTSGFPIVNVDYSVYFGRALRANAFYAVSGRFWGFDPFEMAGYVCGPVYELGNTFISLACHALVPFFTLAHALLLIELVLYVGSPLLVLPTVRNMEGRADEAWLSFVVTTFLFGFVEWYSRHLAGFGLLGFFAAMFVSFYQVSLFWRWTRDPSDVFAATASAFLFVLTPQIHPGGVFVAIIPNAALLLWTLRRLTGRRLIALSTIASATILANLYWLLPSLFFEPRWNHPVPYLSSSGWMLIGLLFSPFQFHVVDSYATSVYWAVLIFAGLGLWRRWRSDRPAAVTLSLWLAAMFLIGFWGSHIPTFQTGQPARLVIPFWLVSGIVGAAELRRWLDRPAVRRSAVAWGGVGIAAATYMFFFQHEMLFTALSTRYPAWQQRFVRELRRRSPVPGRILVETIDGDTPAISEILPTFTGQVFIGGAIPGVGLITHSTLFSGRYWTGDAMIEEPTAFGHLLRDLSPEALQRYFDLYNVALVATQTPEMATALRRFPTVVRFDRREGFSFWTVLHPAASYMANGKADVAFSYDHIRLSHLSPGPVVLKVHWMETLESRPKVPLTPIYLADDPAPFISLQNPGFDSMDIVNAGLGR